MRLRLINAALIGAALPPFVMSAVVPAPVAAQEEVQAVLSGRLLFEGLPADTGTVVLHRVTPEEAGPIDSVSVGAQGQFSFTLPHMPVAGSGEIFFAASRFEGILYFGFQVLEPSHLDEEYAIRTFRTEVAPPGGIAFPIWIREFWIEEAPMGWQVTDAFIVQNPGPVTYVAGPGGIVWQYPLPQGVRGFRVLEAGPSPGAVESVEGMLRATNPMSPGESFVMVQYELDSLVVDLPLPGEVGVARVILREPAPEIRVEGLARLPPQEIEFGVVYQQWAGQELRDQMVRIRPGSGDPSNLVAWLSVTLALLLVASGVWFVRRDPRPASAGSGQVRQAAGPGRAEGGPTPTGGGARAGSRSGAGQIVGRVRKDILVDIARLDEEFGRIEAPSKGQREAYDRTRRGLLAELAAGSEGPGRSP